MNLPMLRYPLFKRCYPFFRHQAHIFVGILALVYIRFLISTITKLFGYYGLPFILDASSVGVYTVTALVLDLYCNWRIYFLIRAHERSSDSAEKSGLSCNIMLAILIFQMIVFIGALIISFSFHWSTIVFAMNYNLYIFYSYPEVVYLIFIRNFATRHQAPQTLSMAPN